MSYPLQVSEETKKYSSQVLSKEDSAYKKFVIDRLISSMNTRNQAMDEFDDCTFLENFVFSRKMANAFIPPRKNPTDVVIVSGTARAKMKALAAAIVKMNLDTNVLAFNNQEDEDVELGFVLSNLLRKSKELDGDAEKKILRIYALFEQGTVHVGETWTPIVRKTKKIKGNKQLDPATGFAGVQWEEEEVVDYICERRLYSNLEIYPGNIREFELNKQPYMARRIIMDYTEASTIFGNWNNWQYVVPGNSSVMEDGSDTLPYNNFRMYELQENQVEVIYYEDLPNGEYNILINGVMMLPAKFGMPWGWPGYSFIKQVLDPINNEFYYGRSLMAELRFATEVLDRILQMLINKTHQSIKPPSANNTGKLLSPRIFDPGQMVTGVDANRIQNLINHQGVTSSEFAMYQELKNTIDMNSVNPVFQGQNPQNTNQTATLTLTMQQQAQQAMALPLASVALMEEKADYLRLYNVLDNWTSPIDERLDPTKKKLIKKYRSVNVGKANVGGRVGNLKVDMMDEIPTQEERQKYSYEQLTKEMRATSPAKEVRLILPILKNLKYRFFLSCVPSEKPSDNLNKILFREMMSQGFQYFGPQELNMDHFKKRWALTWGENPEEVFSKFSMNGMQDILKAQAQQGLAQDSQMPGSEGAALGQEETKQRQAGSGIPGGLATAAGRGGKSQVLANV